MRPRPTIAALAAVVLAVAVLATHAAPVAAGGPYPFPPFGSGTFAIGTEEISLSTPGEAPCEPQTVPSVSFYTDAEAGGIGQWAMDGSWSTMWQLGGDWYQVDFSIWSMGGGYTANGGSPPPDHFLDGELIWDLAFYEVDEECELGDIVCEAASLLEVTLGQFFGTLPNVQPGDGANFQASSSPNGAPLTAVSSCAAPISTLLDEDTALS